MSNIHPTAIIHETAQLHESVQVGPYCVIGEDVSIDEGCILKSHVVIAGPTTIKKNNEFFSFCVIGEDTPDLKFKGEKATLDIGEGNTFREFCKVHRGTAAAVPLCTLQNSLNVLPSPISSVAFSPLNFRSGVSSPITQKEKNSLFFLMVVGPAITT